MAEPDYGPASWAHFTTDAGTQSSELAAPLLSTHAPFQQQLPPLYGSLYRPQHLPLGHPPMPQLQDPSTGPNSNQSQGRSPYPPVGSRHQHYHPHLYPYQFPGPPRPPPAFWNEPDQVHLDISFRDTGDGMQGHHPFLPPRTPIHSHQGAGLTNPAQSPYARRRYDHRMTGSPGMHTIHSEGVRGSENTQEPPPGIRPQDFRRLRPEHVQPNQQARNNVPGQHQWVLPEAQGRRSDRSISPRTSTNRRNFDRYSIDLSHSSTSSDAEEAAARAPPLNRVRFRPREVRPRFSSHRQHFDPNIATPRQIQELKDSLPRRLPSELAEAASKACEICQKDYSTARVAPGEEQENAVVLACGHSFGEFCIFQWFDTCKTHKNKVTCPMCRKQLIEASRYHQTVMHAFPRGGGQAFVDLLAAERLLANEFRGDFPQV
ncbi:hypothetical protein BDW02DRAFT_509878 [Decorospora gaudefroyi]|uniref:RING-type domain-containing protein n=1 Tax=Decorospora gaudefroyi TaxID=184978 RepID=A0A6A5K032_9PLEO|nr:hypothetical protein BDW02DRAFT_509878 [Decorospora gaudefroyi]